MLLIDFSVQVLWVPSFRKQVDEFFDRITDMVEKNILLGFDPESDFESI
ncbi:hypothetical protein [Faecalispora jeddahensis]|nr:hypothetical protein [Faecalispora jeddahensis]